jgi:hypothetical protein
MRTTRRSLLAGVAALCLMAAATPALAFTPMYYDEYTSIVALTTASDLRQVLQASPPNTAYILAAGTYDYSTADPVTGETWIDVTADNVHVYVEPADVGSVIVKAAFRCQHAGLLRMTGIDFHTMTDYPNIWNLSSQVFLANCTGLYTPGTTFAGWGGGFFICNEGGRTTIDAGTTRHSDWDAALETATGRPFQSKDGGYFRIQPSTNGWCVRVWSGCGSQAVVHIAGTGCYFNSLAIYGAGMNTNSIGLYVARGDGDVFYECTFSPCEVVNCRWGILAESSGEFVIRQNGVNPLKIRNCLYGIGTTQGGAQWRVDPGVVAFTNVTNTVLTDADEVFDR